MILKLIEQYPEFKELYADIYELCRNVEGVMQLFSKELLEMDRNTVKLMIDEMQEEIQRKEEVIKQQDNELEVMKQQIVELQRKLAEK